MSQRHPLAIVAGAATILASFPLATVFSSFTWFFYTAIAVVLVVGTAMLVRSARGLVSLQVLAMVAVLLLYLTLVFPSGNELLRVIPTGATFTHFNDLFVAAGTQIRNEAVPVPDSDGLLLLTTMGVGLVAMLVDLAAVGLRRPALAGLPMLAIYSVPVAVLPDGLSVLPFGFAAAGFLWLLVADSVDRVRRFGRRFTGDGRDVDVWEPSPLSSAGRRLGVAGLAIAIVLPLAIPGMTSGLIDRFGSGLGGADGTGDGSGPAAASVDLTAILQKNLARDTPFDMVKVTTNDPSPFYLRFGVADQITQDGFVNRAPFGGNSVTRGIGTVAVPDVLGVTGTRFHAQVQTLNFDMNLVPTFDRLASTDALDSQWLYDPSTGQTYSRRANATIDKKTYSFDYVHMAFSVAALKTAAPIAAQDNAREIVQVPSVPQISDLVRTLTTGKTTEYDKVRSMYDYFSRANGFSYSLESPAGTSGSPIVDFLTIKRGFCVQYAAALAWLVRVAGFPARVAFGFTRGSGPQNGVYTLTNFNLHAWTEVFFPGFGWVPFDSTPAGSVTGSVQSNWAPDTSIPQTSTGPDDNPVERGQPVPEPTSSSTPSGLPNQGQDTGPGSIQINRWWFIAAAIVVLALFVFFAPAWRRRVLRRRRRAQSGPVIAMHRDGTPDPVGLGGPDLVTEASAVAAARRDAHEAWAELLDLMVDYAVEVDESETPRATVYRLAHLLTPGSPEPASELLGRAEERARYAQAPLRSNGLDTAVSTTRTLLNRRASRGQRLRAALLPRSVVLRWRIGWVAWLGRMISRGGRVRDVMTAVNPRRLFARERRRTA